MTKAEHELIKAKDDILYLTQRLHEAELALVNVMDHIIIPHELLGCGMPLDRVEEIEDIVTHKKIRMEVE